MIDQGIMYLIYFLSVVFVLIGVGMCALFVDSSREDYYDHLHDFFKPIYLLFLGLQLLLILLYRLIRWPIMYYLSKITKKIMAPRREEEERLIDEIHKMMHKNQG